MTQGGLPPSGPDDPPDPSRDDAHRRRTRFLWPVLAAVFALVAILLAGILIGGRSNTAGPVPSTTSLQAITTTPASETSSSPTTSPSLTPETPSTTTQPRSTGALTSAAPSADSSTGGVDSWPLEGAPNGYLGVAPSPAFPTALPKWQLHNTWTAMPRAFPQQGTAVSGPGGSTFPSTMNGCDNQRFLLRWRAINPSAQVSNYLYDAGKNVKQQVTANSGWMDLGGCLTPAFTMANTAANQNLLTDVTVSVQQYFAAP